MSRWERTVLSVLRAPTYPLTVAGVEEVTDHYRRIHIEAPELLAREETPPAFWLRLWIPYRGEEHQRAYTVTDVRRDQCRFALEFALHDTGPGSAWAREVRPGAALTATVYTGKRFALPESLPAGYLLLGDPASLPAINDILRSLPDQLPACVVLAQQHADDATLPVHARTGDQVSWLHSRDRPTGRELLAAVERLDGEVSGWGAWVATEVTVTKLLRQLLRTRHRLPTAAVTARGYWTDGRPMGRAARPGQPEGN